MRIVIALACCALAADALAMGSDNSREDAVGPQSKAYTEAVRLIEAEDYGAAVPLLEGVVATAPGDADAWSRLGFSHRKLGAHERALAAYGEALRLQPEHLGANEYLGELYIETGRLDLARERLAVLDKACFLPCDEYTELKEAIAAAEARADGG